MTNLGIEDLYLGDGVYASFNGYDIELDLRGQDDTTRIVLEPSVFANLISFKNRVEEATARQAGTSDQAVQR